LEIRIAGKHLHVSDAVRDYANDRIGRLVKYFDGILRVQIVLSEEGETKHAEIVVSLPRGKTTIANATAKTVYAAIDEVHDKAEKQLTRFKEKLRDRRPGT